MPGVDPVALAQLVQQNSTGILGWINGLAGGALGRMAIFALNIMPYISSSIIIQLMTTVSPHLEQLKKEGEQGRKKINQYTRYGTVFWPRCRPMASRSALRARVTWFWIRACSFAPAR